MSKAEDRLLGLAKQLPPNLRSDWRGTNHFELTAPGIDAQGQPTYWWLDAEEIAAAEIERKLTDDTETGKRLGLLMDLAEAAAEWAKEKKNDLVL